ncbi:MAG: MjaI family restriction endonuclease [Armatimonadetes bacterium]|nr:MjaI family restriction endonuclease [Armatimonadota bacterium]
MNNCALSALVLQERIHNEDYYKISMDEEISEDLIEFINEVAEKIINLDEKECKQFYDFLINKTNNLHDDYKKYQELTITNKSFNFVDDRKYTVTHETIRKKIQTIYDQLESILNIKIEPAPDEWDRLYNVDFFIRIKDMYIGLQIKPINAGIQLSQIFKEKEIQKNTHRKFTKKYEGEVFYIFSAKEGNKKVIQNKEVIDEIRKEIERLKNL